MMSPYQSDKKEHKGNAVPSDVPVFLRFVKSRIFMAMMALLVLYALGGFFLAPYLVERYVPRILQKNLVCEAQLGDVRINPFLFTFEANDFSISETNTAPIGRFDRLFLDFELSGLFRWAWTFKAFQLDNPEISIVLEQDGGVNLAKLIPEKISDDEASAPVNTKDKDAAPPRMVVQNIELRNGVIHVADQRQSDPATADVMPLNISLERVSTLPEHKGPYSLKANLADGGGLSWTGTITLHPLKSSGNLGFSDIKVRTLWKFIRDSLNIQEPGGVLNFNTDYAVDLSGKAPQVTLNNFGLQLSDIAVQLSGGQRPFFTLANARMDDMSFDLASQKLDVGKISFTDGFVHAIMDQEGSLNLQRIVLPSSRQGNQVPAGEGTGENETARPGQDRPWDVRVNAVEIGNMAAQFEDQRRSPGLNTGFDEFWAHFSIEAQASNSNHQLKINHIQAGLNNIQAGRLGDSASLIQIPSLTLEEGNIDLAAQAFTASRVLLEKGHIELVRQADGHINLVQLFSPPQGEADVQPTEITPSADKKFSFLVKSVELAEFETAVYDQTVKPDNTILDVQNINLEMSNVDGQSPMDVFLEFELGQGGSVGVSGVVNPSIPSVRTEVSVTEIALMALQPYIDPHAGVTLGSGFFSTRGMFAYNDPALEADLAYDGRFHVTRLNITERDTDETLLGWQRLKASNIKFRLNPDLLEIPDLSLFNLDGKFVIAENGSTNMSGMAKSGQDPSGKSEPQTEPEKRTGPAFPVRVHKLRVEDGQLYFADLSLRPQFVTQIHNLDGVVTGVSSALDSRAQVLLDGQVDEYGMTKIEGEISIFDPKTYTNIDMLFQNIEMNSMTPYSGKFVGRQIDSGKLSLDLQYRINESQLKGGNQIVVDNLTLGERVESSDAMNLPLGLAIAIMEDENGIIDIGMPVSGDLNDPQFSYGHLIWKAFKNLIIKIATSPFRALGAMLGEDTQGLDAIAFDNGSYEVPPPEKEKLHALAQALEKRPQLKVVVQGGYSPESDGFELKAIMVRRSLAARQGVELEEGEDPGPLDYGNPEIQKVLESMVVERFNTETLETLKTSLQEPAPVESKNKQTTASSESKKTQDPGLVSKALFATLIEAEALDTSALIELADTRSQAIIFEIVEKGKLAPERITTKASEALEAGDAVAAKLELEPL